MELVELYNKALKLVEEVKNFRSQTAEEKDSSLCIIITDVGNVYAGVTGIRISNEAVITACSEYNALMSMLCDGGTCVKQMMTVSFADNSVCRPCSDCIDILCGINAENNQCEVAVSVNESVKVCELDKTPEQPVEIAAAETPETPAEPEFTPVSPFAEAPAFSDEPVSDTFSFEEKFGFDFDDTPPEAAAPVQTLSEEKQEPKNVPMPEQPVMPQGMNPQFIQPDNMQNYTQSQNFQQGYPQQPQGYPYPQPQGNMNPQFIQPDNMQNYTQSQNFQQGYPYPQPQGYPYPQQSNMNPQFVQPDNMQNYTQSQNFQQSYPYPQPYPQNTVQSQPLQSVSPHQSAPYVSSHYMGGSMGSGSVPTGSVPLSGEGKSKFRQRLNKFVGEDSPMVSSTPVSKPAEESLSKEELKKMARDKKRMAKVNADFKKRMKDLGY